MQSTVILAICTLIIESIEIIINIYSWIQQNKQNESIDDNHDIDNNSIDINNNNNNNNNNFFEYFSFILVIASTFLTIINFSQFVNPSYDDWNDNINLFDLSDSQSCVKIEKLYGTQDTFDKNANYLPNYGYGIDNYPEIFVFWVCSFLFVIIGVFVTYKVKQKTSKSS